MQLKSYFRVMWNQIQLRPAVSPITTRGPPSPRGKFRSQTAVRLLLPRPAVSPITTKGPPSPRGKFRRLLLPGELAKHAVSEEIKAVTKDTSCKWFFGCSCQANWPSMPCRRGPRPSPKWNVDFFCNRMFEIKKKSEKVLFVTLCRHY